MPARKPSAVLELSGAYRKNPNRRRPPEPVSGDLGNPPERLDAEAVEYWHELVSMVAVGVLQASDRWAVELVARFMAKATREPDYAAVMELAKRAELSPRETKALIQQQRLSSTELATLRSLMSALGLSPVDRSKLNVLPAKQANPFSQFKM
jgi:phage terminase small subunit